LKPRAFYVDVVRAFASMLVVVSHVFAPICAGINIYSLPTWWLFNLFDSIIRPSAALFIMISGKLFLGSQREDPYFRFVWKRYAKIFLPFFTWSIIYSLYDSYEQGTPFVFGHAVLSFLQGPTAYHLWFMYVILGLYLLMPAMRRFIRSAPRGSVAAVLVVWMGYLTFRFLYSQGKAAGPMSVLLSYSGYALLGYALDKAQALHKKIGWCAFLWLVIVLVNAAGTYLLTLEAGGILNEKLYFGAAPLVAIQGGLMFLLLKNLDEHSALYHIGWLRNWVTNLGQHSYNIYLNHALLIGFVTKGELGFILSQDTGPNPVVGVLLTSAVVLASALGLSMVLRRIPIISKLFVISALRTNPS
jgi:surface polysaccharide O-acyltransferase-like enzyme